ncbi:DUF72 domain-containing protein [Flavobacterium sp. MAH-1]|uniref:DUF72 domain-containing protein n=1 Tax=Flavobacterium agri TaxID=2743471 RepID=A0A7Y8Y4E0_9FLAO|nr:DUF72 domain-containing protein [Flavobacterium agri]NUY82106.1 DUF72 domain-containing protein [Flavobacterium agri]NYA72130.1 DUF72 domain-containing protein [Flavobacterium agri]
MQRLLIGTSAYNNGYWKGLFYPSDMPSKQWFSFYCEHFGTFEINATFYRFPTLKTMKTWHQKSPDGFVYSVKAPKLITHLKRFTDCDEEIAQFYKVCHEGLGRKLGWILFQLPPSFAYDESKLDMIVDSLDKTFFNVVEFRHRSWWRDDVLEKLEQNNIGFCSPSYPNLPEDIVISNGTAYIRLHGKPKLFYSAYSREHLEFLLKKCEDAKTVVIYFNNTASTAGIENALELKKMISRKTHNDYL